MKESSYKTYDELPLFLNAETVAAVIGVSPSSVYELLFARKAVHRKRFSVSANRQSTYRTQKGFYRMGRKPCLAVKGSQMKYQNWKRDAIANYFPMPNEIFLLGLSGGAILVYTHLMYCEDRKTFKCHPSFRTIGESVGMSRNTVQKYVRELESRQMIETEPTDITTKDGRTQNGSLQYTILPVKPVIDEYITSQLQREKENTSLANTMKRLEEYARKHPKTAV